MKKILAFFVMAALLVSIVASASYGFSFGFLSMIFGNDEIHENTVNTGQARNGQMAEEQAYENNKKEYEKRYDNSEKEATDMEKDEMTTLIEAKDEPQMAKIKDKEIMGKENPEGLYKEREQNKEFIKEQIKTAKQLLFVDEFKINATALNKYKGILFIMDEYYAILNMGPENPYIEIKSPFNNENIGWTISKENDVTTNFGKNEENIKRVYLKFDKRNDAFELKKIINSEIASMGACLITFSTDDCKTTESGEFICTVDLNLANNRIWIY